MNVKPFAALAFFLAGLGQVVSQGPEKPKLHTSPFFPLEIGHKWSYRAIDANVPAKKNAKDIVIEVEREENYVAKEPPKDGKEIEKVYVGYILKNSNGDKWSRDHVVVIDKAVQRVHVAGAKLTPPQVFFQPVQKWESDSAARHGKVQGVFTVKPDTVKIGTTEIPAYLAAFRNQQAGDERIEIDAWYAKDVGMVKLTIRAKNVHRTLELRDLRNAQGTILFSTEAKP